MQMPYHDDYGEDRVRDDGESAVHVMVNLVVRTFPIHILIFLASSAMVVLFLH